MSQVQRGYINGFNFIASPTVLLGLCGPLCIEQKFCNVRKVPLWNAYREFSPCPTAVLDEAGHYSQSPKGAPQTGPFFGGLCCWHTYSSHVQYLATMCLRGWHVLRVLILEKEKNQAMTLRNRPVKNAITFSPFYKELTTQNSHLSHFSNDSKYRNRLGCLE